MNAFHEQSSFYVCVIVFGGHLLLQAHEIAWICAYQHTKVLPLPLFMDNIEFLLPVEIGSIVRFKAQVCIFFLCTIVR